MIQDKYHYKKMIHRIIIRRDNGSRFNDLRQASLEEKIVQETIVQEKFH